MAAEAGDSRGRDGEPRITGLRLLTAAPLPEMADFYHRVLGLEILDETQDCVTVAAGRTRLTFVPAGGDRSSEAPFYHLAFQIPENKIRAARDWQRERTPLVPPDAERLVDPAYPADVVHFAHWNAHAVFFRDPAGNLLEHIARHDLDNAASGPFTPGDILSVSEIALVVDDVGAAAAELGEALGLSTYGPTSGQFGPLGDERGLLLVFGRGRNLGFGEGRPAGVFPTRVTIRGASPGAPEARAPRSVTLPGYPYEIVVVE